jgi:hypothetical protein
MISVITLRLVLAAIGLILFIYGVRTGDERMRWAAIAFVAVAVLLRVITPRRGR